MTEIPGFYYDPVKKRHYRLHPGLNNFNPIPKGFNDSKRSEKLSNIFICRKSCTKNFITMLSNQQLFPQKSGSNVSKAIIQQISETPLKHITLGSSELFDFLPHTINMWMTNDRKSLLTIAKVHEKYVIESFQRRLNQNSIRKQKFPFKPVRSFDGHRITIIQASSSFKLCKTLQWPKTCQNQRELLFYTQPQNLFHGNEGDEESSWVTFSSSNRFPTLLCQDPSPLSPPKMVTNVIDQIDEFCISSRDPILAIASPNHIYLLDISNLNHSNKVMTSIRRSCTTLHMPLPKHNKNISHPPSTVLSSTFSPDGRCLLLGTRDGGIEVYDIELNPTRIKRRTTLMSPPNKDNPNVKFSVCDMVFCRENVLLTSHYNHQLFMWDLRLGKAVLNYSGHVNSHKTVKINFDANANIVYCGGTDGNVRVWGLWDAQPLKLLRLPENTQNFENSDRPNSKNRFLPSNNDVRSVPIPIYVGQKFEASNLSSYPECSFVVSMDENLYAYY